VLSRTGINRAEACRLIRTAGDELQHLLKKASVLRDLRTGRVVTYSRKVFIPLTNLCRDRCAYCTFAREPGDGKLTIIEDAPGSYVRVRSAA